MPTDDLLTAAEAATELGTTVRTLNRWADEGKLPTAHKLPGVRGARLFTRSAVDDLAASLVGSGASSSSAEEAN